MNESITRSQPAPSTGLPEGMVRGCAAVVQQPPARKARNGMYAIPKE